MRMPYESFDKSDSCIEDRSYDSRTQCSSCRYGNHDEHCCELPYFDKEREMYGIQYIIGNNDMTLCKKLIASGSEHRKFLRMIHVQAEVKAPRYWWSEADTYKYITKNSSSTMHLITKRELSINDFSREGGASTGALESIIDTLNIIIRCYNLSSNAGLKQQWFMTIKQILPESFNQLRMIDTNYECLLSIYHQRKSHRLTEWREFCSWIESLPYMKEFLDL